LNLGGVRIVFGLDEVFGINAFRARPQIVTTIAAMVIAAVRKVRGLTIFLSVSLMLRMLQIRLFKQVTLAARKHSSRL
jgi:hypothetical protein